MKNHIFRFTPLFVVLLLHLYTTKAQTYQPVTNTITEVIPCTPETIFSIHAEKAVVLLSGWKNNYIQVQIYLSAVNADKKLAMRELNYMHYAITKEKNAVELRNIFTLPPAIDKIYSKLEVKLVIMIPEKNTLMITNQYGDIQLKGLTGNIKGNISFCNLQIEDYAANTRIDATYSEIKGVLKKGTHVINSKSGNIDLELQHVNALTINGIRTGIQIDTHGVNDYRYQINNSNGNIILPPKYNELKKKDKNRYSLITQPGTSVSLVQINTSFETVTIK